MVFSWLRRWFTPWGEFQQSLDKVTEEYQAVVAERDQLRDTVATLQGQNLRLEDRLVAAQQDRDRLWESFQQSLQGERTAYQLHINMSMQRQGAGVPYPDAPHIPEHLTPAPSNGEPIGRRGRMLMSEVLRQATDQAVTQRLRKTVE
jgi:hypothetical protein